MSQLLLPEEIVSDPRWSDLSLDEKERVTDEYAQDLIRRVGPNDPEEYRSGVNKLIDELRSQADPDFLSRQGFVPKTARAAKEAALDVVTAVPGMIMFASAKDRGALGVAREMIQQGTTDPSSIIAGLGESNIAGFYANAQLMGENLPAFVKKHTTRAGSALQSRLDELQQRVMDGDHPPIYDEEGKPSIAFRRWLQGQQSEIDELRAKMHGVEQTEGPYSDVLDSPIQPPNPFKAEADPRLLRSSYNNEALLNAIVATARTRNPKYFNLVKNALSMNDEALQLTELSRKAGPKEDEEGNISLWERASGFAQSPIDVATIAIGPEFLVGRALAKGSIKGAAAKAAGIAAGVGTEVSSAAVEEVLSRPFGNELGDVATEAFAESAIGLGIGAGVGRIEAIRERRATDALAASERAEENRIARIEELQRKREEIIKNGGRNVELTVTDWRTEKDENGKLKRIPTERTVRAKQILINGELQSKGFSSKSLANRAAKVLERKEEVALFTAKHGDRWFIYQDLDKAESPETRSEARIEFDNLQSRFEDFSFDSLEEANRVGDAALRQNKGIVSQYRARKQKDGTYKIRFSYEAPTPQNEFAQRGIKRAEEINKEYRNRSFKTEEAAIQSAQMLEQASPGAVRFDIAQKNGKYYLKATANTVDISIEGQEIRQNLEAQAARRAEERQARSAFIGDRQAQAQEQADAEAARIDQEKMDQVQREVDQENYENFVQEEAEQKVREYLVGEEFDPSPESIDALFGVEPEQGQLASELSQLTESERAARQALLESRRRAEQVLEERRLAMLGQRPTQPEGQRPMGQATVPQARRVQERESLQQEQEAERAGIAAQIREDQAVAREEQQQESVSPEERQAQETRDRISQENALIRDALEDELRSGPDLADDVRNRMMANDARRGRASQAGFIDFDTVFDAAIDAWRFAKGSFQKFAKYMIDKFGQAVNAILPDLWKSTNESIVSRTAQRVQSGNDAVGQNAPLTQQSIPYERAVAEETNDPISAILAENEELNMLTQNPGGERAMGPGDIIPADTRGIQEFQPQDSDIARLPPDEVTWELVQTAMGLGKVVKGLNRAVNAVTYDGTKLNRAARWALGVLDKRGLIDKDSPDVRALISAMQYHQESGTRVALQNALQRQLRAAIGEPFDVSDSGEVLGLNERTGLADLMQEFQSTETGTIDKYGLNDTQVAALRVARHFNQEIQKMLAKEGRLQQYKEENEIEGDNWFTRGTPIDFIEGDQSYMQNRDNGPTPETRHFKLMTFEKGRKFPTQLEGIDAGVVYKNHLGDMLADYYGQALQVISRERFRSKVPTFGIKKQGPKKGQKGVGTFTDVRALQELQNETVANETVFRGFLFDPQTAKVIRESFHDPGSGFQSFDKVNQLGKALIAGFDLSWAAIQLINLWFHDPVKWAKSFNAGIKSLVSAKNANEIYNRADYQQAISELAKLGIQVGVVPEEISGFQSPAKRRNKFVKGLRSVTVDPALRSFQVGVDVAAIEMWLAHKQSKGAMGDQFQVAEMIGNMVGRGKIGEVGISRNQHMIEKLILFSSSYQRSQLNLIASAATGNKYAAAALGRIMIGGAIWGYAAQSLFKALGIAEEEDDDWERLLPWSDKFLRFHVQGNSGRTYQVGINAGWMGYMNLVRKVIDLYNPTNENVGTQSITKLSLQDNILLNFARGKTSPLISNAIDLSLGEDFMGEPLTFGRAVVKNTVPIWLQDLFLEDDNPFTIKAVEALGIGVYNESANRNIRRRMEVMASRRGYSSLEEVPTFREKAEMMFEAAEGNENARYHRMVNSMRDAEGKAKSQGKAKEWNVAWQENQRKKMKEILNQRILDEIAWHNQNDPTYEFGVQVPSFSRDQTVRTKYGNTQYRMDDADTKKFRETYAALFNQHARSLYENAIWKNGAPAERQKIFSKYEDLIKKATLRTLGMQ